MLLINKIKEYKLVNESIGIAIEIMFEHMDESRHIPYELPVCVIVEFKESTFAEETKWRTNLNKNSFQLFQLQFLVRKNDVLLHLFH